MSRRFRFKTAQSVRKESRRPVRVMCVLRCLQAVSRFFFFYFDPQFFFERVKKSNILKRNICYLSAGSAPTYQF